MSPATLIFMDKKFSKWGKRFLHQMYGDAMARRDFRLRKVLLYANSAVRGNITDYSFASLTDSENFDITDPTLSAFVQPLKWVYDHTPNILGDADDNPAEQHDYKFEQWANKYLYRVFDEVVTLQHTPDMCNYRLWNDLRDAATIVGDEGVFDSFIEYERVCEDSIRIDNEMLVDFVKPLRYLYRLKHQPYSTSSNGDAVLGGTNHICTYCGTGYIGKGGWCGICGILYDG